MQTPNATHDELRAAMASLRLAGMEAKQIAQEVAASAGRLRTVALLEGRRLRTAARVAGVAMGVRS